MKEMGEIAPATDESDPFKAYGFLTTLRYLTALAPSL
jgi:hypothetical protein